MLYRRCWHVIAANTVAMRAAGVDPDKVWPPPSSTGDGLDSGDAENVTAGSSVEIDGVDVDDSHHPTGLFRENSMKLVESAVTAPSFETRHGSGDGLTSNCGLTPPPPLTVSINLMAFTVCSNDGMFES